MRSLRETVTPGDDEAALRDFAVSGARVLRDLRAVEAGLAIGTLDPAAGIGAEGVDAPDDAGGDGAIPHDAAHRDHGADREVQALPQRRPRRRQEGPDDAHLDATIDRLVIDVDFFVARPPCSEG